MQKQLDMYESMKLRDIGMEAAILNAEHKEKDWSSKALDIVRSFASIHRFASFMAEDVRSWAENHKLISNPPSKRAWGAIMIKAANLKFIKKVGFGFTKNPLAHRTPATLWESAILN